MAIKQGITIKGINRNAKYKLTYTLSQTARYGNVKYNYSKLISTLSTKKYSYSA